MDHSLPLITTLVGGFVLAYILGMFAQRLKISPMVGYLAAGVISGPFTPGYVADMKLVPELAERLGQGADDIGEPAGLGEGHALGGEHQDIHAGKGVGRFCLGSRQLSVCARAHFFAPRVAVAGAHPRMAA